MALGDKINTALSVGLNPLDPLFGGLIPRREVIEEPSVTRREPRQIGITSSPPPMPRPQAPPVRANGMQKLFNYFPENKNPLEDKNFVIDWTEQKLNLADKELELDRDKFGFLRDKDQREYGLNVREQERKERKDDYDARLADSKLDIDLRKQALEEWKTQNPDGQIEETADGRIFVIDKRTGQSIDTGLKGDNLDERERMRLQHGYRMTEIAERERQQLENERAQRVNPSQQRIAEDDAANELLRDPRYAWLANENIIARNSDGSISINHPDPKGKGFYGRPVEEAIGTVNQFEKDWRTRADARMAKSFNSSRSASAKPGFVRMVNPTNGDELDIPEAEVSQAEDDGLKRVGEGNTPVVTTSETFRPANEPEDDIEFTYNSAGKVIGVRNKKRK